MIAVDSAEWLWTNWAIHSHYGDSIFMEDHADILDAAAIRLLTPLLAAAWASRGYPVLILPAKDYGDLLDSALDDITESTIPVWRGVLRLIDFDAILAEGKLVDEYVEYQHAQDDYGY